MAVADAVPEQGQGHRQRIVAFVNAASGAGSTDDETIDRLRSAGVEVREQDPRLLGEAVAQAVAEGAGAIAIVGGDGSQQAAATVLADGEVPLVVVPGGTWNHFAKALGIGGIDAVIEAIESGRIDRVSLGEVNDRRFLNTAVFGWYPDLVTTRERLRSRWPRPVAASVAFARHVFVMPRFTITIDGEKFAAWMVWVGNGRYGLEVTTLNERDIFGEDAIDVRIALAHRRFPRVRLVGDLLRGRLRASDHLERRVARAPQTVNIAVNRPTVAVGLDAEVVTLHSPLRFSCHAASLPVLIPTK